MNLTTLPAGIEPVSGADRSQRDWKRWTLDCRLVVKDASAADRAKAIADSTMNEVERAISRFISDSELNCLQVGSNRISPLFGAIVSRALAAAAATNGAVNPIAGVVVPDFSGSPATADDSAFRSRCDPGGWLGLRLDGDVLTVPRGVRLGKAATVDLVAARVRRATGTGVLVSVGGDIATAADREVVQCADNAWEVLVQDVETDAPVQVALTGGAAIATSSTMHRTWISQGQRMHHIIDPGTGQPASGPWRTATVVAGDCVSANTASTAAIVLGDQAITWLRSSGLPARLIDQHGRAHVLNGFPSGDGS
jgi:thiamine biosynthesis lipoprotein